VENSTRPVSTLYIQMYHKGGRDRSKETRFVPPYPTFEPMCVVIIFRALGYVADRDIIEHVVYGFDRRRNDGHVPSQSGRSLCHSTRRGLDLSDDVVVLVMSPRKIVCATQSMQKSLAVGNRGARRQEGFLYWIRRAQLLMCKLGRATEDDRDHFGKSDWIWRGRCWEDSFVSSLLNLPRT
jgi:DNA-directed RNA polymerase II subunit RPB2